MLLGCGVYNMSKRRFREEYCTRGEVLQVEVSYGLISLREKGNLPDPYGPLALLHGLHRRHRLQLLIQK